jgi:hypothetical protein
VLTPEVQKKLIDSVHAEVGSRSIDELAAERDEMLLGLLELRTRPAAATSAKRTADHSRRRSQPTPSSCVGLPGSTTEPEEPTMKEPMSGQSTAGTLLLSPMQSSTDD